jgi:transposase-like protein
MTTKKNKRKSYIVEIDQNASGEYRVWARTAGEAKRLALARHRKSFGRKWYTIYAEADDQ